jgi:hypothetical protein
LLRPRHTVLPGSINPRQWASALLGVQSSKGLKQQFDGIRRLLSHNNWSAELAG